ncbi:glycosyl hydrolase family 18 protein [Nocardioides lianchengensis]|uniref:Spore germination protein YaaH n=1 Tax=Nocardioides lianchengensis TaxID=1045774 RepID=A0A1G6R8W9_9ACTN|nr:glycosyl hydrolase family 18 protein [Nocardioides lianchengensis]NYG10338.1 spore germination protein YaaH [Nocardioides lianchengensis]SDD00477.1 Spore germination protein YaaH [Nocardioides lianchengensis]
MRRALVVLVTATALAAPATAVRASEPEVTGYALPDLPHRVLERNAPGLTTLTVVGASITADGRRAVRPPADSVRLGRKARREGLRTELLVSNYSDRIGDFDTRAAGRLLRSPANVRRVARQLASYVEAGGWDGVNLDLEALRPQDGPGLVRLAAALQRRMPAARTVSVDVSAKGSVREYRRSGYRLGALGRAVDLVQLMAYDQHGPTWSGPGPIGALTWQRRTLGALLTQVPAAKVDLGVAGYGYTWPRRGTGGPVTVARARELVRRDGARATWDARAGEWRARLDDGTALRWSDRRSLRLRRALARGQGLHGLAIWRIGSADTVPAGRP